jgi:hypothetical protein
MNEVRPRSRKRSETRVREIQGMLAMRGSGSEEFGTDPTSVTTDWRTDSGGATPPTPTPTRAERATIDVDVKPLPYRSVLAAWPDDWRERWGRRANDLEAAGLSWRDAEGRAFLEVWNDWRTCASVVERN